MFPVCDLGLWVASLSNKLMLLFLQEKQCSDCSETIKQGPCTKSPRCEEATHYFISTTGWEITWTELHLVSLTMIPCFGVIVIFFSAWITNTLIQDAFAFTDIITSPCRISGITVIKDKKGSGFDFSGALAVCAELGLTLASRAQIENAQRHGFETCNFGWVKEQYIVISRIIPNIRCGQNKTGVVPWHVQSHHKTHGFCFNSSDTWVDSCKPEDASTTASSTDASTEMNITSTISLQDTSAIAQTSKQPQTKRSPKFRVICVTETIPPPTTQEPTPLTANRAAFVNDGVVFGGVPTALLVLALIFFAAAAVLAVCYIKKYKKTSPLSNKKGKKEVIETKDIKENKTSCKTSEQEPKKNGKKAEELQARSEPPVKCLEAEV